VEAAAASPRRSLEHIIPHSCVKWHNSSQQTAYCFHKGICDMLFKLRESCFWLFSLVEVADLRFGALLYVQCAVEAASPVKFK